MIPRKENQDRLRTAAMRKIVQERNAEQQNVIFSKFGQDNMGQNVNSKNAKLKNVIFDSEKENEKVGPRENTTEKFETHKRRCMKATQNE